MTLKTVPGELRWHSNLGEQHLYIIVYHDIRGRWLNILKFDSRGVWRDSYNEEYLNWRTGRLLDPEEWQ